MINENEQQLLSKFLFPRCNRMCWPTFRVPAGAIHDILNVYPMFHCVIVTFNFNEINQVILVHFFIYKESLSK